VAELKTQNNLKGVVFEELGEPHHGTENYWNDNSLSGDNILNRMYQIFFEGGADSIVGFFPWIWEEENRDLPAGRHEHIAPNNIIKQYYTASTIPSYSGPIADMYVPSDITYGVTRTLLQDNFEDDSNWNLGTNASIGGGVLEFRGHEVAKLKDASSENWQNYTFSGKFMVVDNYLSFFVRRTDSGGYQFPNEYRFAVKPIAMVSLVGSDGRGGFTTLREIHYLVEYNKWYSFTVVAKGNLLQFFIDNTKVLEYLDFNPLLKGTVELHCFGRSFVDNVIIQEIS